MRCRCIVLVTVGLLVRLRAAAACPKCSGHMASSQHRTAALLLSPALQADPAVSGSTAALEEFAAAPWLLPPRTPALPYAGVHRLDQLMALRSAPAGRHRRSIAVLLFSKAYAVMAQNSSEQLGVDLRSRGCLALGLMPLAALHAASHAVAALHRCPAHCGCPRFPPPPGAQSIPWSSTAACATTWPSPGPGKTLRRAWTLICRARMCRACCSSRWVSSRRRSGQGRQGDGCWEAAGAASSAPAARQDQLHPQLCLLAPPPPAAAPVPHRSRFDCALRACSVLQPAAAA